MIQVRNGVFETNSSSTHSICISREYVEPGDYISFHIGEFGRNNDKVDAADYLYTAILEYEDWEEKLDKLKSVLDDNHVSYDFEEPKWEHSDWGDYLTNGCIDHAHETSEFVNAVLNNDDMLMRLLFGDSFVYTGCDNWDDENPKCYAAYDTYWEDYQDENGEWQSREMPNPNHDEEHYEYFFKGN